MALMSGVKQRKSANWKTYFERGCLFVKREYGDYIEDIIDAMTKAEDFIGSMTKKDFLKDEKTRKTAKQKIPLLKPIFQKMLQDIEKGEKRHG